MVEVRAGTWEELSEGRLARRVVAEIDPHTLLIALGEMTTANWTVYEFYKPQEYKELLRELEVTSNWQWIERLKRFEESLGCAEKPIGYIVFWYKEEVVDIIVLVLFGEENYVNLVIYRLGGEG
jgi:hypothetical protein